MLTLLGGRVLEGVGRRREREGASVRGKVAGEGDSGHEGLRTGMVEAILGV